MENENVSSISSDHMVKILQKENEQLKAQVFKRKEYKDNLILSSLLEVLQLQRQKIDSLEAKNKKMIRNRVMLLDQLKGLEMKNKTQTFVHDTNTNQTDYSILSSKSQSMKPSKSHRNNNVDIKGINQQSTLIPSTRFKKKKVKLTTTSCVVEKNNKDEEISKIPYDYDNLISVSVNGLKNKSKP